jgi:hypothetical protein
MKTFFPSDSFNGRLEAPLDLAPLSDGQYKLGLLAKDIKGNGGNVGESV